MNNIPVQVLKPRSFPATSPLAVVGKAADLFGVPWRDIIRPNRTKKVAHARFAACWALRQTTRYSYPKLATIFPWKDHTSAVHAIKSANEMIAMCDDYHDKCQALLAFAVKAREIGRGG